MTMKSQIADNRLVSSPEWRTQLQPIITDSEEIEIIFGPDQHISVVYITVCVLAKFWTSFENFVVY